MTITIKEIRVKATIERNITGNIPDEIRFRRIKQELYRELKEELQQEKTVRRER